MINSYLQSNVCLNFIIIDLQKRQTNILYLKNVLLIRKHVSVFADSLGKLQKYNPYFIFPLFVL